MTAPDRLQGILHEYHGRLDALLGADLDSVVLYGSQARKDAEEGSDIDVLCVMKRPFDYGELINRTAEASADLSLRNDVLLSTAFALRADYDAQRTPFLMNVRREGVAV